MAENAVLVLAHSDSDRPAAVGRALDSRGIAQRVIRADRGDLVPATPEGARALLVMGGPAAADEDERFPHLPAERALIRAAVDAGLPVLGVCLGSQLLAVAMGGAVRRGAAKEIGWYEVERTAADPWLDALPERFTPFHWHEDAIVLPPGGVLLARSATTPVQAFRVGARAYGLQFHLELGAAEIAEWCASEARLGLAKDARRTAEQERLASALFRGWPDGLRS
jgi:GMP synthase-like glutamine amidotransferase